MKEQWKILIAIGVGAAIGTLSRYALNLITLETGYPLGTMIENLTGSLLLGFLTAWFLVSVPKEWLKAGLGVGLCGGFTTMSTLAADAAFLLQEYTIMNSILYVFGSMVGGILLAWIGYRAGTILSSRLKQKRAKEVEG
ncbi:fluoride efflux transporter FluC [Oceanobacillus salinisoli]|uniref:fluoride efflux transporter FluC n=1 Tax=Oceanobacillus salinisoli TaxID=2678611 RepID=UPI0012E1D9C8|nr:CrcB family protein [Oceanobacillus salinisoli]